MYMVFSPEFPYLEGELDDEEEENLVLHSKCLARFYFSEERGDELAVWFYLGPYHKELGIHPLYCATPFSPEYSPIMLQLASSDSETTDWEKILKRMIYFAEELLQTGKVKPGKVYTYLQDCKG
jgi:hypothetical protein